MIIHCMIFCWPGQEQNTQNIVRGVGGHVDRLTVIDATASAIPESPECDWVKVDKNYYYGMKFSSALQKFDGDVFLQIQADAGSTDWKTVVQRCKEAFQADSVGVWAPDVDYSFWTNDLVNLSDTKTPHLKQVTQTDCIVWAMSRQVVERLQKFDYTKNNLGWGVDWAAIAYCYANKLLVVRDTSVHVSHPKGTGYKQDEAEDQFIEFIEQLDFFERVQYLLIQNTVSRNIEKKTHANSTYKKISARLRKIQAKLISP